jgi:hypothetical protein
VEESSREASIVLGRYASYILSCSSNHSAVVLSPGNQRGHSLTPCLPSFLFLFLLPTLTPRAHLQLC